MCTDINLHDHQLVKRITTQRPLSVQYVFKSEFLDPKWTQLAASSSAIADLASPLRLERYLFLTRDALALDVRSTNHSELKFSLDERP